MIFHRTLYCVFMGDERDQCYKKVAVLDVCGNRFNSVQHVFRGRCCVGVPDANLRDRPPVVPDAAFAHPFEVPLAWTWDWSPLAYFKYSRCLRDQASVKDANDDFTKRPKLVAFWVHMLRADPLVRKENSEGPRFVLPEQTLPHQLLVCERWPVRLQKEGVDGQNIPCEIRIPN